MNKLILTKGLPGSGKTYWSNQQENCINICKDDLRKQFPNYNEKKIIETRNEITKMHTEMKTDKDIIWSDTNLNPIHEKTARELFSDTYEIVIQDFTNVPLETCIKQDLQRLDSVGKDVIMEMYYKWLFNPETPKVSDNPSNAYIVDIDGTVALMNGRSPYDNSDAVLTDLPRKQIIDVIEKLGEMIIFVSGRQDTCRDATNEWLRDNFKNLTFILHMRKESDVRPDYIVKEEIYESYINGNNYNILGVFDDRPQVIRMWERKGLTVFNVGKGYEF